MSRRRFVGRETELGRLQEHLEAVARSGQGTMLALRGRRQVGKSRLIEELIARSGVNAVFYTASRQSASEELRIFTEQIAASGTAAAAVAQAGTIGSWEAALTIAAGDAREGEPVVIVIDELPLLIQSEPAIEAIVQKQWDRSLEAKAVLLVLIGSDISMMKAIGEYGRPLYGRMREMTLRPLTPAALSEMLKLDEDAALDAYLAIGGFPRLAETWQQGDDLWAFLRRELESPESPLIVLGERSLNAELPPEMKARSVLEAIGAGERTFTAILQRAGVSGKTLETTLETLIAKGLVDRGLPYSATPHRKLSRYSVSDPYLRFWLRFIRAGIPALERGRGETLRRHIKECWPTYSGRAIEPVVAEAVEAMLPSPRFGKAAFVGSYWNRDNTIAIDLVGGRDQEGSSFIDFAGSIKWRKKAGFHRSDLARLIEHRSQLPGATEQTLLIGVSRNGFEIDGLDVQLRPAEIVGALRA